MAGIRAPDKNGSGGTAMSPYRDLLAEVELTMVPSLRFRPEPAMYVPADQEPETALRGGRCSRSFWCSLKERVVDVEFATKSIVGFPRLVGIRRCSAFDEPADVACGRHCLDSEFRRRWPFALPTAGRRPPLED
jgi:hypothetical protein